MVGCSDTWFARREGGRNAVTHGLRRERGTDGQMDGCSDKWFGGREEELDVVHATWFEGMNGWMQ